jgi:hypothetical protein
VHGRDEKCAQNFGLENVKRRDHLEDIDIDGSVMLNTS